MVRHQEVAKGLRILLEDTRINTDIPAKKLIMMQEKFLQSHQDLFSDEEKEFVRYYLRASIYKFYLANLSLEQLWALSVNKRFELFDAIKNSLDSLDCSDDELLLISLSFEEFLFIARSFLDFYMLYICIFIPTGHRGKISRKIFFKALANVKEPYLEKAEAISAYFDTNVFGSSEFGDWNPKNWGTLLISLRDKIAHRDIIRPSFDSDETLAQDILFNWPTLQGTTYERFCQYIGNGIFTMLRDVSPILYELEWKAGPPRPGLW